MADWTKKTYKIVSIDDNNTVKVHFDCDDTTQDLATLDTSSAEALTAGISDYLDAYVSGKQLEEANLPQKPPKEVTDLVGKIQTATTEA